jgi:hypothetical protein
MKAVRVLGVAIQFGLLINGAGAYEARASGDMTTCPGHPSKSLKLYSSTESLPCPAGTRPFQQGDEHTNRRSCLRLVGGGKSKVQEIEEGPFQELSGGQIDVGWISGGLELGLQQTFDSSTRQPIRSRLRACASHPGVPLGGVLSQITFTQQSISLSCFAVAGAESLALEIPKSPKGSGTVASLRYGAPWIKSSFNGDSVLLSWKLPFGGPELETMLRDPQSLCQRAAGEAPALAEARAIELASLLNGSAPKAYPTRADALSTGTRGLTAPAPEQAQHHEKDLRDEQARLARLFPQAAKAAGAKSGR